MALPDGFLDELRTRVSISDIVGRKVTWDPRKSNQAKGDWWAPCPFHQEKTASFHVDDRKGYYYCFGCHAKGDVIGFLRETENLGFMEAIEVLASQAGMQMPERDPRAAEAAKTRASLVDVMEEAVRYFRLQLKTAAAEEARAYLVKRGLDGASAERWELGFASDSRRALFEHLTGKGIDADQVIAAGLAAKPDDGGTPYDRFRGRILFPIRDARGRAIAFGGRAMAANARAKYLNSPETELFDKGRNLYNHAPAREAVAKKQPLIVAEGYMDVIALSEHGFTGAVAPLGTAITEHQLRLLWRISPEPIVALDGDRAGVDAALRLIDLALPLIEAGQSLRFAMMPEKQDPDDVLREGGAPAMQALIDAAQPMVTLLWKRATEGRVFDSPERRATLDKELRETLKRIADPSIRAHYSEEIRRLRGELFFDRTPRWAGRGGRSKAPATAVSGTRSSVLAAGPELAEERLREAAILATCLLTPEVLNDVTGALEETDFGSDLHRRLARALLSHASKDPEAFRDAVAAEIGEETLETLLSTSHVHLVPSVRSPGDPELARRCVESELAKLEAHRGVRAELEEAKGGLTPETADMYTRRLAAASAAKTEAEKGQDDAAPDTDLADNGLAIDRNERQAFEELLGEIGGSHPQK